MRKLYIIIIQSLTITFFLISCHSSDLELQKIEYYYENEGQGVIPYDYIQLFWNDHNIVKICDTSENVVDFLYENGLIVGTKIYRHNTLICECSYIYQGLNIVEVSAYYHDSEIRQNWYYLYDEGKINEILFDTSKLACNFSNNIENEQYLDDSTITYLRWEGMSYEDKWGKDLSDIWKIVMSFHVPTKCSATNLTWKDNNICHRQDYYRQYYYQGNNCKLTRFHHMDDQYYIYTDKKNPFRLPQGVGCEFQFIDGLRLPPIDILWSESFKEIYGVKYYYNNGYPMKMEYRDGSGANYLYEK